MADVASAVGSTTPSRARRAVMAVGLALALGAAVWVAGAERVSAPGPVAQDLDTAVVLDEDALAPPPTPVAPSPSATPTVPPEDRTTVVCSNLQQRSIPTAELSTDEPGAVVQVGSRSCVVARPEGAVVP